MLIAIAALGSASSLTPRPRLDDTLPLLVLVTKFDECHAPLKFFSFSKERRPVTPKGRAFEPRRSRHLTFIAAVRYRAPRAAWRSMICAAGERLGRAYV